MTGSFQYPWGTTRPAALEKSVASARDTLDRREADIPGRIEAYRKQLEAEIAAERADLDVKGAVLTDWHRSRETAVADRQRLKALQRLQRLLPPEKGELVGAIVMSAAAVLPAPTGDRPSDIPTVLEPVAASADAVFDSPSSPGPAEHQLDADHEQPDAHVRRFERVRWFTYNSWMFARYMHLIVEAQPGLQDTDFYGHIRDLRGSAVRASLLGHELITR